MFDFSANGLPRAECDAIYWPDVVFTVDGLAMAFEGILLFLHFCTGIEIFNSDTAFHRPCCVTYTRQSEKTFRVDNSSQLP